MAAKVIPHPTKASYGGEDAFFISTVGGGALGVADGVGGWSYSGINPAEYARTFMHLACAYLEGKSVHPVQPQDLQEHLVESPPTADASMDDDGPLDIASTADSVNTLSSRGALAAAHAGTRLPGSATACVLRLLRESSALSAANVGDSGFLLARNGHIVFQSTPQEHYFDCPYQFAAAPEFSPNSDHVEVAAVVQLDLLPGDVIVAGSDGLWDNLPEQEVLACLPASADDVAQAADRIAEAASAHANDDEYESPYTQEALKQGFDLPWWSKLMGLRLKDGWPQLGYLKGGKLDDITVVVAVVEEVDVPEPAAADSKAEMSQVAPEAGNQQAENGHHLDCGPSQAEEAVRAETGAELQDSRQQQEELQSPAGKNGAGSDV